jgi:hypothetical protein
MSIQSSAFSVFSPFGYCAENGEVTALLLSHGDVESFAVVASVSADAVQVYDARGALVTYAQDGDVSAAAGTLIKYVVRGGKLKVTGTAGTKAAGSDGISGSIDEFGGTLTLDGTGMPIDANATVFIDGGDGTRRLGSLEGLRACDLTRSFQYYADTATGRVQALAVDLEDTYANVFIMINSVAKGWDGGEINIVNGLSFADGAGAQAKEWNCTSDQPSENAGPYPTMVRFKIAGNGVLSAAVDLDNIYENADSPFQGLRYDDWHAGSGGTFAIAFATNGAVSYTAFEANAVLYKVESGHWTAMRPTAGNFNADEGKGLYTVLRTDPNKAYDVIIKTN